MRKLFICLIILITLFVLYGLFINPQDFKVNEYAIKSDEISDSFDGFVIAHFSDVLLGSTQTMENVEHVIEEINNLNADMIVFTGDLISSDYKISAEEKDKLKMLLKSLDCTMYKYAIVGDNDLNNIDTYKEIMTESDFELLNDQSTYLFYKDMDPIEIIGLTEAEKLESIINKEDDITPSYKILLTHKPDVIDNINLDTINLVLTGHSLGGQIKIPFVGGLLKKDGALKYVDNYYVINNTEIFVSSGLGTEKYKFRAFNSPSINKYRVYKNQ